MSMNEYRANYLEKNEPNQLNIPSIPSLKEVMTALPDLVFMLSSSFVESDLLGVVGAEVPPDPLTPPVVLLPAGFTPEVGATLGAALFGSPAGATTLPVSVFFPSSVGV